MQPACPRSLHRHHWLLRAHPPSCLNKRADRAPSFTRRAPVRSRSRSEVTGGVDGDVGSGGDRERLVLVERWKNGTSKRYILDKRLQLRLFRDDSESTVKEIGKQNSDLSWLPNFCKEFILPAGFPASVSEDYLDYMILQLFTNVTGWVCHTLVTSSLLRAIGMGSFSGTTAAASAAAIRWVSKDGLGAVGRLLIGGRFGNIFDDDPKQWRMYADFVGSAGSIFELCTPIYPEYFLLLASLGNFAKASAKGLKDPSFRVIQNHFSISGNLGEVAAKEEVWEVIAQLLGLALGILLLDTPGLQKSYFEVSLTWITIRLLHLWLRYQSLSILRFQTINLKRARILVRSHILLNMIPGYMACNEEEDILSWERFLRPCILFGASIKRLLSTGTFREKVEPLLKLYCKERYILVVHKLQSGELEFIITFKVGATSMSLLKSLWQAYWIDEHWRKSSHDIFGILEESLVMLERGFDNFLDKLQNAGWTLDAINLKVPKDFLLDDTCAV